MAAIRFRQTAPSRLPTPSLIISPLAIALIALAQAGEARGEPYHEDHAFRKTYKSYLDYDTILKAPAWDQEIDRPPVLARKAIKLAEKCETPSRRRPRIGNRR